MDILSSAPRFLTPQQKAFADKWKLGHYIVFFIEVKRTQVNICEFGEMCLLTASSSFSIARSMTRMVCMLFFLIRWTGVSISLSTQLQPIHTTTAMVPRTTWATHTAEVVTCLCSFLLSSLLCWAMIGIYMMFTPQKPHSCNASISSYLPHTHAHVYLLPTVVPQ